MLRCAAPFVIAAYDKYASFLRIARLACEHFTKSSENRFFMRSSYLVINRIRMLKWSLEAVFNTNPGPNDLSAVLLRKFLE